MFLLNVLIEAFKTRNCERLSSNELEQLQLTKFRNLVEHAYKHSKFYKRVIDENKIDVKNCTVNDFPILDKSIALDNFDDIVTNKDITKAEVIEFLGTSNNYKDKFKGKYTIIQTSGSSGEKGMYPYKEHELIPVMVAMKRAAGTRFNQKVAYIAKLDGHYAAATLASLATKVPLVCSVTMLNVNDDISTNISKLNKLKPSTVSGYAFLVARLAQAQAKGLLSINPEIIVIGGEPLLQQYLVEIKDAFPNAKILNVYACSEMLVLGTGEAGGILELVDDYVIIEKQKDCIYCTNLFNYTFPLIRYKLNDEIEPVCVEKNTKPYTTINALVGRVESNPLFINDEGVEDFISGLVVTSLSFEYASAFQMVVKSKLEFDILVEVGSDGDFEKFHQLFDPQIKDILTRKKMGNVKYKYTVVDKIEIDAGTGKFKAIII